MGKLSSLKKEILKSPEDWYYTASKENTIFGRIPRGARRLGDQWVPIGKKDGNPYSYAYFVRSVLAGIGIRTDKPRAVAGVARWSKSLGRYVWK